ncbi:GNAT family N-acetyltransferase [Nafulsella turpanensis]|uniref:GNAT family N-acetyltransferase n=1 Tax=Nafulsella turpanensis TaxID=1265690 RepID=UPI00034C42C1|nr:GNAT family N-acetyltransferase [Nafulsella turpanensis]
MKVDKITSREELEKAFAIREKVFVEEQKVSKEEEYDEFEESAVHFLAYNKEGKAGGTARWRFTDKGVKLERFAVLKENRGSGIGSALVARVLEDVQEQSETSGKSIYLHAQLTAVPLYEKFGFRKKGDQFDECGIMHYKMIKE